MSQRLTNQVVFVGRRHQHEETTSARAQQLPALRVREVVAEDDQPRRRSDDAERVIGGPTYERGR